MFQRFIISCLQVLIRLELLFRSCLPQLINLNESSLFLSLFVSQTRSIRIYYFNFDFFRERQTTSSSHLWFHAWNPVSRHITSILQQKGPEEEGMVHIRQQKKQNERSPQTRQYNLRSGPTLIYMQRILAWSPNSPTNNDQRSKISEKCCDLGQGYDLDLYGPSASSVIKGVSALLH